MCVVLGKVCYCVLVLTNTIFDSLSQKNLSAVVCAHYEMLVYSFKAAAEDIANIKI